MCPFIWYFNWCFSSIKEMNRLISKECVFFYLILLMDVLLSKGMSNIYYWEKLTFSSFDFLGKKIWRNALALKSKKVEDTFGETFFWKYRLQLPFLCKILSQISFNLFCLGDKRLLSEFLRKWGWFQGHNERFPKYLG